MIFKGRKGITLIALIVTVIILLILAGISITMITGQNRNTKQSNKCSSINRNCTE